MGEADKGGPSKREIYQGIRDAIIQEGYERRVQPDFSLLDFVREMVLEYGHTPAALYFGLEEVARKWFDAYSAPLITTISNALGLTPQTDHAEIVEKMMPYIAVNGKNFARDYFASMGFTTSDIAMYVEQAEQENMRAFKAGELTV